MIPFWASRHQHDRRELGASPLALALLAPSLLATLLALALLALALQALSFCKSSGRPRFVYLLTVLPGDHLGGHPGVGPRGCPIGPLRLIAPGPRHVAAQYDRQLDSRLGRARA